MKCCFLMTLACAVPALGQMMYNPPAAGGAPAASPASPPAVQPNAYQPSRQGDAKSLYGNELPFLNPQDGTVTINGTTLNMGSFREIEARFNKYLSQPEESTEDAKEYQKIFEKLHETLSMRKEKLVADNVVRQVVDLLTPLPATRWTEAFPTLSARPFTPRGRPGAMEKTRGRCLRRWKGKSAATPRR